MYRARLTAPLSSFHTLTAPALSPLTKKELSLSLSRNLTTITSPSCPGSVACVPQELSSCIPPSSVGRIELLVEYTNSRVPETYEASRAECDEAVRGSTGRHVRAAVARCCNVRRSCTGHGKRLVGGRKASSRPSSLLLLPSTSLDTTLLQLSQAHTHTPSRAIPGQASAHAQEWLKYSRRQPRRQRRLRTPPRRA